MTATVRGSVAASLRLSRERLRRAPRRTLATWFLQAIILLVVGWLLPGVLVNDLVTALIAAAVIAGFNALVRPVLVVLTLPLTVATFGLLSLVINTTMIVLAAPLVPGLEVNGFVPALALAVVLTVVTTIVNVVLALDEDETFYNELARRISSDQVVTGAERPGGLVMIQIDGLAAPILRNAIRVGTVPRMASWVRSGEYSLAEWECPPPSQTSASQAGILHGSNDDIPAFRWYEKESGRLLVSNNPTDAAEIERRVSDGDGLLHGGGTSVGNLFSGDAAQSAFVMSRISRPVAGLDIDAFSLYFMDPGAFIRTLVLTVGEFLKELVEARRQRVHDIQPRVHRGSTFAFLRAATNVVLRDLNTTFVMRSMALGVPAVYVDLTDYDEIAHHAGPERLESLRALTGVDRVVASLERASKHAPRDYRFVLLSDHGQSQGATFAQRYGQTLEALIHELMGAEATGVVAATGRSETFGPVNALLTELAQRPGITGRTASALGQPGEDGTIELGDDAAQAIERDDVDLVVCASGNLANVYFPISQERLRASEIDARYPGLIEHLATHPGISFLLVATADGPVVLGANGVHHLSDDRIEGVDPLAPFGERAADHLRRLDGFPHVGDILVNSSFDPELEEVAAFEELVGSHGGMGGPQNRPFLLHPTELEAPAELLVGAPAVHAQLKRWAASLRVDAPIPGRPPGEAPATPRAIPFIAAYQALIGVLLVLLAALIGVAFVLEPALESELEPAATGVVVLALGLVAIATSYGLWRRRHWAWVVTLLIQGFNVLQFLLALASGGYAGFESIGLLPALLSLGVFYYLTRPHVMAAFRPPG